MVVRPAGGTKLQLESRAPEAVYNPFVKSHHLKTLEASRQRAAALGHEIEPDVLLPSIHQALATASIRGNVLEVFDLAFCLVSRGALARAVRGSAVPDHRIAPNGTFMAIESKAGNLARSGGFDRRPGQLLELSPSRLSPNAMKRRIP